MDEVNMVLDMAQEQMEGALIHLNKELVKIRAGKAHASMVDGVSIEYYGANSPLSQVSNINTPDPRTITIQPWDKSMLEPIERAIINANLGLNPQNNGEMIMINVPALTEERRKSLVKQARSQGEDAKVSLRSARKEANDEIKKLEKEEISEDLAKDSQDRVQKLTDDYSAKVEVMLTKKEADIMTV